MYIYNLYFFINIIIIYVEVSIFIKNNIYKYIFIIKQYFIYLNK
jgi:hypothetical protein